MKSKVFPLMKQIKVMSVFGTRPEAVKMCPLVRVLDTDPRIDSVVCLTGQHREMLEQVMNSFGIRADIDLHLMKPAQTLTSVTADVLTGVTAVLQEVKPQLVLVHGDTTTSMAAALAAFYCKIPVGHVEAGLRTYDRYSPFPEEMNRRLTGQLASVHFAPTELSREHLNRENITEHIYVTGNTALDAFQYTIRQNYRFEDPVLSALRFEGKRTILLTAHRRENIGAGIEGICRAAIRITEAFPDVQIVYPVHLNPAVRNTVFPLLQNRERICLTDPVSLTDMHNLLAYTCLCMTDSGGLQEEAPHMHVPVLCLRTETERPEAVEAGTVRLAGIEPQRIFEEASRLLTDPDAYRAMAEATNPYGDGHASERIAEAICREFGL